MSRGCEALCIYSLWFSPSVLHFLSVNWPDWNESVLLPLLATNAIRHIQNLRQYAKLHLLEWITFALTTCVSFSHIYVILRHRVNCHDLREVCHTTTQIVCRLSLNETATNWAKCEPLQKWKTKKNVELNAVLFLANVVHDRNHWNVPQSTQTSNTQLRPGMLFHMKDGKNSISFRPSFVARLAYHAEHTCLRCMQKSFARLTSLGWDNS